MKTYNILNEKKKFVYMVVEIEANEEWLADDIIEGLYPIREGKYIKYQGLVPLKRAIWQLSVIDASPYTAGYSVWIDGNEERRMRGA